MDILAAIDAEISRLQKVRSLLADSSVNRTPRKAAIVAVTPDTAAVTADAAPKRRGKRKMSAAARKRIAEAQKARWAKVRATEKSK